MAKEKLERHGIIRELIREKRIANQEELASMLHERGLAVAQATLSRDIKEMGISKLHDESGYYYSLSSNGPAARPGATGFNSSDSIVSVEFSRPVAVVKTHPGHANMVAAMIDSKAMREIAGTIAGDDTILLVIRDGFSGEDLLKALGKLFRQIERKRLN